MIKTGSLTGRIDKTWIAIMTVPHAGTCLLASNLCCVIIAMPAIESVLPENAMRMPSAESDCSAV